jgi:hypothetical protein
MTQEMMQESSASPDAATPRFKGQAPDERVHVLTRAAWPTVILPAWPLGLSLIVLALAVWMQHRGLVSGLPSSGLILVAGGVGLVTLLRWGIDVAYPWWFTLTIITDRRVIHSKGGITVRAEEIPLSKIQEVRTKVGSFTHWLLRYGDVVVFPAGGEPVTLANLANPPTIANVLMQARVAASPAPHSATQVQDPALQTMLENLAQIQPLPEMPEADPILVARWPLRHALSMPLEPGERVLATINRHWVALVRREAIPLGVGALILALLVVGALAHQHALVFPAAGAGLVTAIWALLSYLNFVDDAYILTTQRILDVNRRFFVLYEMDQAILYKNIQEVATEMPSLWARMLGYGTVRLFAGGNAPPLAFDLLPHPRAIAAMLNRCREVINARAETNTTNRERGEMQEWFTSVLAELVMPAPDLTGLMLEDAITHAYANGLRLVVMGERVVIPGAPIGVVVAQSPFPSARVLRGSDISVTLSTM